MVSITISVPEEVRKLMKQFPEVNWSGLVRQCISEKAERLKLKEELLKNVDKETDLINWAVEIGRKAKKGRFEKLKNEADNR